MTISAHSIRLLSLPLLAVCAVLTGPGATAQTERPELVIANKTHAFGKAVEGAVIEHDFVIENRGTGVLRIRSVRTTCDCTTATLSSDEIQPRGKAVLHAKLDTSGRLGPQMKTVYLSTNDLSQPVVACTLRGTVTEAPRETPPVAADNGGGDDGQQDNGDDNTTGTPIAIAPDPVQVAPPKPAPAIVVANPIFDFGRIARGKVVEHEFLVRNTGNASLTILRVSTSCGCTSASALPTIIEPGQEGRVRVSFDTKGRTGEQRKTVTIHSDDPDNASFVCVLKGQSVADVDIAPTLLEFGRVSVGTTASKTFTVTRLETTPLTIKELKCTVAHVKAQIVRVSRKENSADVEVTLQDNAPIGKMNTSVFVITDKAMDYSQRVRITAEVVGDIDVTPRSLHMFLKKGANDPGVVRLRRTGNTPISITAAQCEKGLFLLNMAVIRPGEEYEIYVTPHLLGDTGNFARDNITIRTTSTSQPVITVPILARLQ